MSIKNIMKFQSDRALHRQVFDWENETMNIAEELLEAKGYDVPKSQRGWLRGISKYIRAHASTNAAITWLNPSKEDMVDAFADIIVFCVGAIMKLGYNPEKVLAEVAMEINSRKGEMKNGKFEKYLDDESKSKWHHADFSEAKL